MSLNRDIVYLLGLCDELLLHIFAFLDVPELLSASRTCHRLRHISLDPILHHRRLQLASSALSRALTHRPSLSSLQPPEKTIYLSRTHLAARALSRSLIAIRLNRRLEHRPSASWLVGSNILPKECCRIDRVTGEVRFGVGVSPGIVSVRRRVEWEGLRDRLRGWIEERRQREARERPREEKAPGVRVLVRRFARPRGEGERRRKVEPPRANVLGLRRFWERVGREGG